MKVKGSEGRVLQHNKLNCVWLVVKLGWDTLSYKQGRETLTWRRSSRTSTYAISSGLSQDFWMTSSRAQYAWGSTHTLQPLWSALCEKWQTPVEEKARPLVSCHASLWPRGWFTQPKPKETADRVFDGFLKGRKQNRFNGVLDPGLSPELWTATKLKGETMN